MQPLKNRFFFRRSVVSLKYSISHMKWNIDPGETESEGYFLAAQQHFHSEGKYSMVRTSKRLHINKKNFIAVIFALSLLHP